VALVNTHLTPKDQFRATITATVGASDSTITIVSATSNVGATDWITTCPTANFVGVISQEATGKKEKVLVASRSGTTLTVTGGRGYGDSTANSFDPSAGAIYFDIVLDEQTISRIQGNQTDHESRLATVETRTTDAITEGTTNLYFLASRAVASVLTGLSTATNAAITAADTVLTAAGKLQKQITDHLANTSNPHSVTKAQVGLTNVTDDAQLKRAASDFSTFTVKGTPVSGDKILIEDSGTGAKYYITVGSLPTSAAGEANTASALGTAGDGASLVGTKVGVDLPFKRIKAGTNITLTEEANDVVITASGGGGASETEWTDDGYVTTWASSSTFTVTNDATAQAIFVKGRPLAYQLAGSGGFVKYGIVTNYSAGTVTVAGVSLGASTQTVEIKYKPLSAVVYLKSLIGGNIAVGDNQFPALKYRPCNLAIVEVAAELEVACTGANATVTIGNNVATTDVLTSAITITASNADTAYSSGVTVSTTNQTLTANNKLFVNIDQVGSTIAGANLSVMVTGVKV